MNFDYETINQLAQGTTSVSGALDGVARVVRSFKELLQSPKGASDAEIEAAVEKLALTVENAKLQNSLLQAQVALLDNEVRRAQEAQEKLDAYELRITALGAVVYALKVGQGQLEQSHVICAHCYEDGRRSILQGDAFQKTCPRCKTHFAIANMPIPQAPPRSVV